MRYILPALILVSVSGLFADQGYQTDWSGGSGVTGPVTDWGASFNLADYGVSWASSGILTLLTPQEHSVDPSFGGAYSVYAADIDGDGDMDVLGAAHIDDDISWWKNTNGIGTTWIEYNIDTDFEWATSVFSVDIDNDGDMDVLGAAGVDDDITLWKNTNGLGTTWIEYPVDTDFDGANSVYSEDIDGDGDMDILGAAFQDNDITWWENANGSGSSWIEHTIDGQFNGAVSVYSEDVDGDGDMDVLGAARTADDIAWWENTSGSGTAWTKHSVDSGFDGASSVYSEDFDGDGDMDVLGGARNAGEVSWWENLYGSGTSWLKHNVASSFDEVESVYAEDIDGDGDMDILGAACIDDEITWWQNSDGFGTTWTERVVETDFNYAKAVYSEDMNNDGSMDILGAAGADNDITWWEVSGRSVYGALESSVLDTGTDPQWDYIEWTSDTPSGSSVSFQVRASDDYSQMGTWSDTLYVPGLLQDILSDGDRYLQYRTILMTSDPDAIPVLSSVSIFWDPLGLGDDPPAAGYILFGMEPNPVRGTASVRFSIPNQTLVNLFVFDLAGRTVGSFTGEFDEGVQQVVLGSLSPGVYLTRMSCDGFMATQRFVVLE